MAEKTDDFSFIILRFRVALNLWFQTSGLKQKDAAKILELTPGDFSGLLVERSCSTPRMDTICAHLDIDILDFLLIGRALLGQGALSQNFYEKTKKFTFPQDLASADENQMALFTEFHRQLFTGEGPYPEDSIKAFRKENYPFIQRFRDFEVEGKCEVPVWTSPLLQDIISLDPDKREIVKAVVNGFKKT